MKLNDLFKIGFLVSVFIFIMGIALQNDMAVIGAGIGTIGCLILGCPTS